MTKEDVVKVLNRKVIYDGHEYTAVKYEAWKDKVGKLHHSLVLYDGRHSTMTVPIERIDCIEGSIQHQA